MSVAVAIAEAKPNTEETEVVHFHHYACSYFVSLLDQMVFPTDRFEDSSYSSLLSCSTLLAVESFLSQHPICLHLFNVSRALVIGPAC